MPHSDRGQGTCTLAHNAGHIPLWHYSAKLFGIFPNTKKQYLKEPNIISCYAAKNFAIERFCERILLNLKGPFMKNSNILAGNAAINQLQKDILFSTKGL